MTGRRAASRHHAMLGSAQNIVQKILTRPNISRFLYSRTTILRQNTRKISHTCRSQNRSFNLLKTHRAAFSLKKCTSPFTTSASPDGSTPDKISTVLVEEELETSQSIDLLFSIDEISQASASKKIADALSQPPSLPAEFYSHDSSPQLDATRILWASLFDDIEEGKSTSSLAFDVGDRNEAAALSGEEEQDAVVGSSLTYGEIDFDAMAALFRAVRALGGLREPGGAFWDLGAGAGRPVLAAALLHDFDIACGVELQEPAFNRSRRALDSFERSCRGRCRTKVLSSSSASLHFPALFSHNPAFFDRLRRH